MQRDKTPYRLSHTPHTCYCRKDAKSKPFPKHFISWHHTEIIPLQEVRWHWLVTHSKQCSRSQGGACSTGSAGQECSFSKPQPSWGCSALHSSWITAVPALGRPLASPVCVFMEGAVHPWQCGTEYQSCGSHAPETDAHSYRCRSCVSMLRWTHIRALSCFYFRAMGSWYNEGVFHMIAHIYFQETGRRKFFCLVQMRLWSQDPESRSCTAVLHLHHKADEISPVGWGASMVADVLNQSFLSVSMLSSHAALAGAGHGPATSLADKSSSRPQATAYAAALVTVCTLGALRRIRSLQ